MPMRLPSYCPCCFFFSAIPDWRLASGRTSSRQVYRFGMPPLHRRAWASRWSVRSLSSRLSSPTLRGPITSSAARSDLGKGIIDGTELRFLDETRWLDGAYLDCWRWRTCGGCNSVPTNDGDGRPHRIGQFFYPHSLYVYATRSPVPPAPFFSARVSEANCESGGAQWSKLSTRPGKRSLSELRVPVVWSAFRRIT